MPLKYMILGGNGVFGVNLAHYIFAADKEANEVLTIPAHQHVSVEQLEFIISKFKEFARMMER